MKKYRKVIKPYYQNTDLNLTRVIIRKTKQRYYSADERIASNSIVKCKRIFLQDIIKTKKCKENKQLFKAHKHYLKNSSLENS